MPITADGAKNMTTEERFWPKVDIREVEECWEWMAFRDKDGRGLFYVDRYRGNDAAHRVAWELTWGKIPEGLIVRHFVCDNPPCCNPFHLALGTMADNTADMMRKGRNGGQFECGEKHIMHLHPERRARGERNGSRAYPERQLQYYLLHPEAIIRGEAHYASKLTDRKVRTMRAFHALNLFSLREMARIYGVSSETARHAILGRTWKHLK